MKTVLLLLLSFILQTTSFAGPWKGMAILGNGKLTAVYSDDARIQKQSGALGIQHLYYKNYTMDYIRHSQASMVVDKQFIPQTENPSISMKNFHTAQSEWTQPNGEKLVVAVTSHPKDAILVSLSNPTKTSMRYEITLRKKKTTSVVTSLDKLEKNDDWFHAVWSDKTHLGFLFLNKKKSDFLLMTDSVLTFMSPGNFELAIVAGDSEKDVLKKIASLKKDKNPFKTANQHWAKWIQSGKLPKNASADYLESYKRNLYAARSANIQGHVPADLTGQFVTQGMPQLYPRDAMMSARVFLETGHFEEAKQIITFWKNPSIPQKSKGEWFARYNAFSEAVNGGDGARYDEPEWDANGYYIELLDRYHEKTGKWLAKPEFVYELMDFLVARINEKGLLYEGGIIEWTGFLPSTNLTCAKALKTASKLAKSWKNPAKAAAYLKASETISANLDRMINPETGIYADVRTIDRKAEDGTSIEGNKPTYMWGTAALFGVLWGYPDHETMQKSMDWYTKNTVILGGGMQYFTSPDGGLAGYGQAAFFFMTAAAVQYELIRGDKKQARYYLDWLIANGNSYGLMPERIYPDGSDCSPATPLTWCCGETALAILKYSERGDR